jgi:predicted dienelactone hydrolase
MWKILLMAGTSAILAGGFLMSSEAAPRPDAPPLALRGSHKVGVKTIQIEDASRKRSLTLEVWYPADFAAGDVEKTVYKAAIGDTKFDLAGRALRNAKLEVGKFPLVIVSHGQAGSRFVLTYLTEHLASEGYVVAAIDHTGSTYGDITPPAYVSSIVDRPLDMLFSIGAVAKEFKTANENNVALMGYSYGGYTSLNAAGVGLDKKDLQAYCTASNNEGPCFALPYFDGLTAVRGSNVVKPDPRVKAVFVMAPYGIPWLSKAQFAEMNVPLFVAGGSNDDIAVFKRDALEAYKLSGSKAKYMLTLESASHNAWTNNPPEESRGNWQDYERWFEPVWDRERLNDITKHFATAFLNQSLLGDKNAGQYLQSNLFGFLPRTTIGVKLETAK